MDDSPVNLPHPTDSNWNELLLQQIKSLVNIAGVPVISPLLCEFLDAELRNRIQNRVNQFHQQLIGYIQETPERVLQSEAFFTATELTMRTIANEHSKKKRQRLSSLYKKFLDNFSAKAPDIEEFEMWLHIATALSENALYVLSIMEEVELTYLSLKTSHFNDCWNKFNERISGNCELKYLDRFIAELQATGVVAQSSGRWGGDIPYVTDAGIDFLIWLAEE